MGISFTGGREYVIERFDLKPKIKPANSSWFYFYVYLEVPPGVEPGYKALQASA